jgi:hypothetical protein
MKKYFIYLICAFTSLSLSGCQGAKEDINGVPIVTDVEHIADENGNPMSTQEFLDKWCPGQNKTPIYNATCVMVKTKRDKEKNIEQYQNSTILKW